jgi:outer membrane receptor protein involved in Fe transport
MTRIYTFGSLLLLSSALVAPAALAQGTGGTQGTGSTTPAQTATPGDATAQQADDPEEEIEVSAPGVDAGDTEADEEIVVVGRNIPNAIRSTPEVISVLSSEDIARTGEGDVAGALQRVTGLSVVGAGFVFVRGLGDRYSLALLNGSPLPSPEPLRRVVPLDIFPTSVIASAVVQKSYSVNYPGEFGGGVINLTSQSIPREPFLSFGISGQIDTDTTGRLGYTYFGSDLDFSVSTTGRAISRRPSRRGDQRRLRPDHGCAAPRLRGQPAQRRDDGGSAQPGHPRQHLCGCERRLYLGDPRRPCRRDRRGRVQQQLADAGRDAADLARSPTCRNAADELPDGDHR